jgi:hypothetical protein
MTEDLELLFNLTGVDLEFEAGSIKGLPNYLQETLYNGTYKVEKQDFRFIISTVDCVELAITSGNTFTFEDTAYTLTFKVTNQPIHDLTGVTELICEYISKEPL